MFFTLALLVMLGPILAIVLTAIVGIKILRTQPVIGLVLLGIPAFMLIMLLWEFQYDLGILLPDIRWLPSGASGETAVVLLAGLLIATLGLALFKWPHGVRTKGLAIGAAVLWTCIIAAFTIMGQINFSH